MQKVAFLRPDFLLKVVDRLPIGRWYPADEMFIMVDNVGKNTFLSS